MREQQVARPTRLDALGNWTSFTDGAATQTRQHNAANEIVEIDGDAPVYDGAGNLGRLGESRYVYDAWNRLMRVEREVDEQWSTVAAYGYDGRGFRITRAAGEETADYYYNESWQVVEERKDGVPYVQYVWDVRYIDSLLMRFRDANGDFGQQGSNGLEETLYYLNDANMNVTAVANASGAVVERYSYGSYGERAVYDGSWNLLPASAVANERGMAGHPHDPATGLVHMRRRDHHVTLGRFMQADDSFVDGMSLYQYALSSPASFVDFSGASAASTALAGHRAWEEGLRAARQNYYQGQMDAAQLELQTLPGHTGGQAAAARSRLQARIDLARRQLGRTPHLGDLLLMQLRLQYGNVWFSKTVGFSHALDILDQVSSAVTAFTVDPWRCRWIAKTDSAYITSRGHGEAFRLYIYFHNQSEQTPEITAHEMVHGWLYTLGYANTASREDVHDTTADTFSSVIAGPFKFLRALGEELQAQTRVECPDYVKLRGLWRSVWLTSQMLSEQGMANLETYFGVRLSCGALARVASALPEARKLGIRFSCDLGVDPDDTAGPDQYMRARQQEREAFQKAAATGRGVVADLLQVPGAGKPRLVEALR